MRAFVGQITRHNVTYNAIVQLDLDAALERAKAADEALARGEVWGPMHGVPVTVKDTYATRGLRTTAGDPTLVNHIPQEDAVAVALLRRSGAIVLAKTNAATLAMDMQTTNALFGTTNNPWNVNLAQRSPEDATVTPLRERTPAPASMVGLRLAYMDELGGVPVSREVADALLRVVETLRAAGATVEKAQPKDFSYQRTWETWGELVAMQGGYGALQSRASHGAPVCAGFCREHSPSAQDPRPHFCGRLHAGADGTGHPDQCA
ncbi:MAG: amidase [Uliginosibacterium sp.]|nr:amidase [Uliginosibacterium sp.]